MGYVKHDAVLFTFWAHTVNSPEMQAFRALVDEMPTDYGPFGCNARQYLVGPVEGVNGAVSYALLPDDSKEGWDESDAMDVWRARLIEAGKRVKYAAVVWLQYAGDDRQTIVHYTTDSEPERRDEV